MVIANPKIKQNGTLPQQRPRFYIVQQRRNQPAAGEFTFYSNTNH